MVTVLPIEMMLTVQLVRRSVILQTTDAGIINADFETFTRGSQ